MTGMKAEMRRGTGGAAVKVAAQFRRAAARDGPQGGPVGLRDLGAKARQIGRSVAADEVRQLEHGARQPKARRVSVSMARRAPLSLTAVTCR